MMSSTKFKPHMLTKSMLNEIREQFLSEDKNILASNICSKFDPIEATLSRSNVIQTNHIFQHRVDTDIKPVTNQKNTGRCWIFAALNNFRIPFMKKWEIDEFEFSQSYLFFWDKVERCNYFLNCIYETALLGEKVEDRLVSHLLQDPISDGGQWQMLVNLIKKYGLVPKAVFPESFSSESSGHMNAILKYKLREFSRDIRAYVDAKKDGDEINHLITEKMKEVFNIISICLGVPPESFVWEYYDNSKKYQRKGPMTPIQFFWDYVNPTCNISSKVCLVSDPRETSKYNELYTIKYVGNVVGGTDILYNNQTIELLLALTAKAIENGDPVWFGCDVSKRFANEQGIEDLNIRNYKLLFGSEVHMNMSKADRMIYGESAMSHAMNFTGVSYDENGAPAKFRVENSWGEDKGNKGFIIMTAEWFKEFVFEIVVDEMYVPQVALSVFQKTPIPLPPWDPMGTLAM